LVDRVTKGNESIEFGLFQGVGERYVVYPVKKMNPTAVIEKERRREAASLRNMKELLKVSNR